MNNFNQFAIITMVATASLLAGMIVAAAIAQDNMTLGMDNSTGMTDNSAIK